MWDGGLRRGGRIIQWHQGVAAGGEDDRLFLD